MTARSASREFAYLCRKLALSLLSLLVLTLTEGGALAREKASHGSDLEAVRLVQEHYFLGPIVLTVCDAGLHLDCTKHMGFAVVAHAPDWTVSVFRTDEKAIKSVSLKQFDNVGMMPQTLQTSRPRYVPSDGPQHIFRFFGFDARRVVNRYQTQEFLTLKGIAPEQVERIVFSAYRLPTGGGLPVRYMGTADSRDYFSGKDQRGQRETNLTTSSVKRVTVSPDLFVAPKHYHAVSMMQEVVTSTGTRSQAVDFQNIFEVGNPVKLDNPRKGK